VADVAMGSDSIGSSIRRLRQHAGLTVEQLAARAGLRSKAVGEIETGASDPPLSALNRLADALGVSVGALLEPSSDDPVRVTSGREVGPLWRGPLGGHARLLTTVSVEAPVEVWRWCMAPGEKYTSQPHPRGVIETMTLFRGDMVLTVGDVEVLLSVGSTATFQADVVHVYANFGRESVDMLMTVHLPRLSVGYRPLDTHAGTLD
jgi:transcriptional regulator with XRE-family HTH domain